MARKERADKQTLLWAAGIATGMGLLLSLVTWPQFEQMHALRRDIEAARSDSRQGQAGAATLRKLDEELQRLSEEASDFSRKLPERDELGPFLEQLAHRAELRRLFSKEVRPGNPETGDKVVSLPIDWNVSGPFDQVFGLLRDIESLPRLTRIERLNVALDREEAAKVTADIRLRVFFQAS